MVVFEFRSFLSVAIIASSYDVFAGYRALQLRGRRPQSIDVILSVIALLAPVAFVLATRALHKPWSPALTWLEQAAGYPFQQWYVAAGIGRQVKPILRPHWENIDPDKEHYLILGVGYEFLRTTQSGQVKHEDRITIDLTPSIRPLARLLLRDRNWVELRWIDGNYSTTYRNMVSGEVDFLVHDVRFTPYGTAEVFYDGPKHSWDQEWYTAGVQWPYKRVFMLETYYRREHCPSCTPENWNAGGITLHFFFKNGK